MAEGDRRITCPVCGKTHSSISGGYCPYCEKVTSDDPVVMPKKKPYDQVIEEQQDKVRPDVKHGEGSYGRPIATSNISREEHPIEHPKPAPKSEVDNSQTVHVVIDRDNKHNPNVWSALSLGLCAVMPWFCGYPFGLVGYNRANAINDNSGRILATYGKGFSIFFMILYDIELTVLLWFASWVAGLIFMIVIIVLQAVYFVVAYILNKQSLEKDNQRNNK